LNVHGDNDVRQAAIHTAEPLVSKPSAFEVEMAIEKLERYKSPGIDHIPTELIKAGGSTICSEIHRLNNSVWNNQELPEQWKESIILPVYEKGDKTDCSNYRVISLLSTVQETAFFFLLVSKLVLLISYSHCMCAAICFIFLFLFQYILLCSLSVWCIHTAFLHYQFRCYPNSGVVHINCMIPSSF
jgi:hypothetical protein